MFVVCLLGLHGWTRQGGDRVPDPSAPASRAEAGAARRALRTHGEFTAGPGWGRGARASGLRISISTRREGETEAGGGWPRTGGRRATSKGADTRGSSRGAG